MDGHRAASGDAQNPAYRPAHRLHGLRPVAQAPAAPAGGHRAHAPADGLIPLWVLRQRDRDEPIGLTRVGGGSGGANDDARDAR